MAKSLETREAATAPDRLRDKPDDITDRSFDGRRPHSAPRGVTQFPPLLVGCLPMKMAGGFSGSFGPIYWRQDPDGPVMAFRVDEQHISVRGVCHGGVIAAFADMQALAAQRMAGIVDRFLPTINLSVDYIAGAPRDTWLVMRTKLLRTTRNLMFTEAIISRNDDDIVARASGIYKFGSRPSEDPDTLAALWPDSPAYSQPEEHSR